MISAESLIAVTLELTKGLYWDAYLLPIGVVQNLISGNKLEAPIAPLSVSIEVISGELL